MDTVERTMRVKVPRCEAKTKPQWYRPDGGHCPYQAVVELDGQMLCQSHATRWVRGEGQALAELSETE